MKEKILEFNQKRIIAEGLDLKDIHILEYVINVIDSGLLYKRLIQGKRYHWIKNKTILNDLPVLEIETTGALRKRIKFLAEKGFIEYELSLIGGSYTFYRKGARLKEILYNQ